MQAGRIGWGKGKRGKAGGGVLLIRLRGQPWEKKGGDESTNFVWWKARRFSTTSGEKGLENQNTRGLEGGGDLCY